MPETVREKAAEMIGDIRQVPSMYSAIKVAGKPLYERARKGETVEVPERTVHIESIEVLREMPDHGMEIRVRCGRGTYIRTLCDDLGRKCGCPAHMRSLTRTKTGSFLLDTAITPDQARALAAKGELKDYMLPVDFPLQHIKRIDAPESLEKLVWNGAKLPFGSWIGEIPDECEPVRIYLKNEFWGIAERRKEILAWRALITPENKNGGTL